MSSKGKNTKELRPRLRVLCGAEIALGPGKVELLELLAQTGSIMEAARKMGISYMRAWTLLRTMNACFQEPLVTASRGGRAGGGAQLTKTGRRALALYHEMNERCVKAARFEWKELRSLLRD